MSGLSILFQLYFHSHDDDDDDYDDDDYDDDDYDDDDDKDDEDDDGVHVGRLQQDRK